MKVFSAVLLIILIAVVAYDFSVLNQNKPKTTTPIPTSAPLPSLTPSKDSPREPTVATRNYEQTNVNIRNYTAEPNSLTVKVNTIVKWTNSDKDPHQIVGDKWKSRILNEKETFSQAFEKPGNYYYKDPNSPQLSGVIIVE